MSAPLSYARADSASVTVTIESFACADGLDNDGDSLTDHPLDPGCSSVTDDNETDVTQCSDGTDNDSDGNVDFPADLGCDSTSDNDETGPSAPSGGGNPSGGGGGGGTVAAASPSASAGSIVLSGRAYPGSDVVIMKGAQVLLSTRANESAAFKATISNVTAGNNIFSLYSEDSKGNRSSLLTFPINITQSVITNVDGIFLSPTISTDKTEVKRGNPIRIFGQTTPGAEITITVNSEEEHFLNLESDEDGVYSYAFNTSVLEYGNHSAKSSSSAESEISQSSKAVVFAVGDKDVQREVSKKVVVGDGNSDGKVNLVDFSIAAYWFRKPSPPKTADLNGDGKVNLVDFSIMAFNWTG